MERIRLAGLFFAQQVLGIPPESISEDAITATAACVGGATALGLFLGISRVLFAHPISLSLSFLCTCIYIQQTYTHTDEEVLYCC